MKLEEKSNSFQFNQSEVSRGDLSSRVENMYELLKDINSELHNIRVRAFLRSEGPSFPFSCGLLALLRT